MDTNEPTAREVYCLSAMLALAATAFFLVWMAHNVWAPSTPRTTSRPRVEPQKAVASGTLLRPSVREERTMPASSEREP